jgi:hypothetical protein
MRKSNFIWGIVGTLIGLHLIQDSEQLTSDTRTSLQKAWDWTTGRSDDTTVQKSVRSVFELPTEIINGLLEGIGFKTAILLGSGTWVYMTVVRSKKTNYKKNRATWTKTSGGWSRNTY